jgi:hypothetical protein
MCEPSGPVGVDREAGRAEVSTKLGKNWIESSYLSAHRIEPRRHGTAVDACSTACGAGLHHAIGWSTSLRGLNENEYIRCGPFSWYASVGEDSAGRTSRPLP